MNNSILLECFLESKHFVFKGTCFVERDNVFQGLNIDYENLEVFEIIDGKEIPFNITSVSWAGAKLDAEDAIADVIGRYSRNETFEADGFKHIFLCDEIKKYLDVELELVALSFKNRDIPHSIFYGTFCKKYSLELATDKFLYYIHDDECLMVNTETGAVVSDNYFAEVGLDDSLEEIDAGTEQRLLYNNNLRKVFLSYGMSGDSMIILTDAPKDSIEEWCYKYNQEMENGENTYFDSLNQNYSVKVLFDSELENTRDKINIIGHEESYEISDYIKKDTQQNEISTDLPLHTPHRKRGR